MPQPSQDWDVLVVGGGNAGFSAAISAAEEVSQGGSEPARVLIVDKCPESWAGGNSYFTAGAMRCVHGGLSDVLPLVNNVDTETASADKIDLDPYTARKQLLDTIDSPFRRNMTLSHSWPT